VRLLARTLQFQLTLAAFDRGPSRKAFFTGSRETATLPLLFLRFFCYLISNDSTFAKRTYVVKSRKILKYFRIASEIEILNFETYIETNCQIKMKRIQLNNNFKLRLKGEKTCFCLYLIQYITFIPLQRVQWFQSDVCNTVQETFLTP